MADIRCNAWWFIMYPDSAPDNWFDILEKLAVPIAVSPLHEADPLSDDEYKPHWHVIIKYGSVKAYDQALEVSKLVHGTIPKRVDKIQGAFRYLCHLDQPNKPQYDLKDITLISGFDPNEANKPTDAQIYKMITEIVKYIVENNITYYIDLLMMCMFDDTAPSDWGYTVAHNTTLFSGACESLRKKNRGL